MELISKEVVRRIIDSGRTREQMIGMVESAVTFESSTDCISREAVLEIRTGEWQQDMDGVFLCSECGSGYEDQPTLMGKPMFAFCPICGVRMKKGEEE